MIKQIIQYPTIPSQAFDGVVRHYNDVLYDLLQDLKDTIDENKLEALAAYQIGSPLTVIVIKKKNGDFLEIINPIIITKEGSLTPTESTAYYPGFTATTKRHQKIKLMFEDRDGKQHFLSAEDDLAILIQRKTDYLLGANFRVRMNEEEKNLFDAKLKGNSNTMVLQSCRSSKTTLAKKILNFITVSLMIGATGVALGLLVPDLYIQTLAAFENYLMIFIFLSLWIYFFFANYEGKKYTDCTSCQTGNIIGTLFLQSVRLLLLFVVNYFIFW